MEESNKEVLELLKSINERLEFLEKEAKYNREQWEDSHSFGNYMKRWGGFYLAGLLADETLRLNGNNNFRRT